jgi:hypothetical protein
MAELDDAIKLVTNPGYLTDSDTHSGELKVNSKKVMSALRKLGAGKGKAQVLLNDAVIEVGGRLDAEVLPAGRAEGTDRRRSADVCFVPVEAVQKTP